MEVTSQGNTLISPASHRLALPTPLSHQSPSSLPPSPSTIPIANINNNSASNINNSSDAPASHPAVTDSALSPVQSASSSTLASPALPPTASTSASSNEISMATAASDASEASAAAATLAAVAHSAATQAQTSQAQAALVGSGGPALPNPLPPGYNKTTPLWRRSHDSTHILCNACALFFKMKGRPRPISLKTDVIKSRNRSKGKSTSKDRNGPGAKKQDRGESASRGRGESNHRKSAPGGVLEGEEDELEEGPYAAGKDPKVRRVGPPGYPPAWGGAPYASYAHAPHPHQHQPYPPPRGRSRSTSTSRRERSRDGRAPLAASAGPPPPGQAPPYPYPPPGAYHMSPEGYPYYYPPPPAGYPGYGAPFYPPPPPNQPYPPHAHPAAAQAAAAAHALTHPPPPITHAQSDSRSGSKGIDSAQPSEAGGSERSSASPPPAGASHSAAVPPPPPGYPYYGHGYPHPPSHMPYGQSPLNPASTAGSSKAAPAPHATEQPNGRVTLAPMVHFGANTPGGGSSRASTPGAPDDRVSLPSLNTVAGQRSPSSAAAGAPSRHTSLFSSRGPSAGAPEVATNGHGKSGGRDRGASVSSVNSGSASGSSDGLRSPESSRPPLPWGPPSWVSNEDERRGRPERRYEDTLEVGKGKGRGDHDDVDELDEEDDVVQRMDGVEAGLGELRVVDQYGTVKTDSSRSRSSGTGERGRVERPRHSGAGSTRGRSHSTSRARGGDRSGSSSSRTALQIAEAEIARLKTKVSELTFLNSLMQSRLGQLEGPGRVPSAPFSGLIAPTPAPERLPDPDEEDEDTDEAMQQDPSPPTPQNEDDLARYLSKVNDPSVRNNLLNFFKNNGSFPGQQ